MTDVDMFGIDVIKKHSGWYETNCPYCNDTKHHLQISPDFTWARCFRCGTSVPIQKLFTQLGLSVELLPKARAIATAVKPKTVVAQALETISKPFTTCANAIMYAKKRNVYAYALLHKWRIGMLDAYIDRLIIPIYMNTKCVGYTGRHLAGGSPRYLTSPGFRTDTVWFNWNSIYGKQNIVIVEGLFDAISVQQALPFVGSIACLGKEVSSVKAGMLEAIHPYEVTIMLDASEKDTEINTSIHKMSGKLINGYRLSVATLSHGDPNSVPYTELQRAYYERTIIRP